MADINQPKNVIPDNSAIKTSKLNNFLSSLFGWRRSNPNSTNAKHNLDFVKVDVSSDQKIGQALADYTINNNPLSEKLDKLFNNWMTDNTDKCMEIQDRKNRVDQLEYAVLNEPILGRTVSMYADEACQLDEQDTILNIETPDPRMTRDMYKLLAQWGITQTRIRATIEQLATYGDAFWANKITDKGVERIIPLKQLQITDRLEFNPVEAMEKMKRKEGAFNAYASSNYLIDQMLDTMEDTTDFADMFDTKLFGFAIENDLVVPPWAITHFRVGADGSEYFPFGTSPIIGTLSSFKQIQSTIALQSLARVMNFPIQIYKVKTSDSMDEGRQFGVVNKVREAYDNIGVNPSTGSSEVYTVNTKVWVPEGLLEVETVDPKVETGNIDDIKLYQDRLAVAAGIPKAFFSDEFYDSGSIQSGKALTQQYKPFARQVYSIQTAFLESLADLFRIHFAITGQYDFRIPFTISMKYPAVEETSEHVQSRRDSMELATDVIELVKASIGAGEDDMLPPDIVRDIIGKYTFLDPADVMKWTRDARYIVDFSNNEDEEGNGPDLDFGGGHSSSGGPGRSGGGLDLGGNDSDIDLDTDDMDMEAEGPDISLDTSSTPEVDADVVESKLTKEQRLRERKLTEAYKKKRDSIYFTTLQEHAINDFNRLDRHVHVCTQINSSNELFLETLAKENNKNNKEKLQENFKF